jgi:hypothetical protein
MLSLALVGAVFIAVSGCSESGPKLYQAKGVVKYKGAPLADASVTLMNAQGRMSVGTTNAQGEFTVMTFGRPGAELGAYQVGIIKTEKMADAPATAKPEDMIKMMNMKTKSMPRPKSEIPEKYGRPASSGFSATVVEDETKNVYTFDLTE